jgi:hypothetical protein
MPASNHTVELTTTKEIELFLPLVKEVADDFGDPFLLSMLHWCGFGSRPAPLAFWQVFLIRTLAEVVGVSGLYRQPGSPAHLCWLGWFAIRQKFRRKGLGSPRFTQPPIMRDHWAAKSSGFTPVPLMKSQRPFTPNSISNFWGLHAIVHPERRWMILTPS